MCLDILSLYEIWISVNSAIIPIDNGLEDMGRGKDKLGQSERVALTYIHYQI